MSRENFTRDFVFDRSTKGTHVFKEVVPEGAAMAIGSLYIKKSVAPADASQRNLRVQVEFLTKEDVENELRDSHVQHAE